MADIKIVFRGDEFIIPESRAFEVAERVEEIATLPEILGWAKRPQFRKMARCLAEMMRAVGGRATEKDVHAEMMAGFRDGNPAAYFGALNSLIAVLMDGAPESTGGDKAEKTDAS